MFYRKTVKYFFIISCVIAIIYPAVSLYTIFPSLNKLSVNNAEDEAIRIAKHLASMVLSEDGTLIQPSEFSRAIEQAEEDLNLEKLKIFSEKGVVLYSSDPQDIGKTNTGKYFNEVIASGNVYTNVVEKNSETLEGRIVGSDVVETYVPIQSGNQYIGAFEIYYDITSYNQLLNKIVLRSSLLTFVLMFSFFVALIVVLLRADKDSAASTIISDPMTSYYSPVHILFMTALSIFAAEALVMTIISVFPSMTRLEEAVLDSTLLIMMVSPVLYYFVFRPLIHQVRKRRHAEDSMRRAHEELEKRVLERTAELATSNRQLTEEMAERMKAVRALRESEEKYRTLVNSTDDSIYLVDRDCKYLFMNKKHIERLGLLNNEFQNRTYGEVHPPEVLSLFKQKVDKIFDSGKSIQYEYKSDLDGRYFLQTLSPVRGTDGKIIAISVVSKNITDRKMMEEELRTLSLTDELTGLYNRRGLYTLAEQQLRMANRLKKGIYILYADLDNLKDVNDAYGHPEGDRMLVEFALILKENYRESDIIARIGGDEFVVIPVGTSEDGLEIINSRFYQIIEHYNRNSKLRYDVSASIGIAYYDPETPCTIDALLAKADQLMYGQKKEARQ